MKIVALLLLFATCLALEAADSRLAPPVDETRLRQAPVVLRIRRLTAGSGDKYHWSQVELLSVIKNESRHSFSKRFEVGYLGGQPEIPAGISTLYLERYNPNREDLWRLLDGSTTKGVTHNSKE